MPHASQPHLSKLDVSQTCLSCTYAEALTKCSSEEQTAWILCRLSEGPTSLLTLHPPRFPLCVSLREVQRVFLSGDLFSPSCWGQVLCRRKQFGREIHLLVMFSYQLQRDITDSAVCASLNLKPFVETLQLKTQTATQPWLRHGSMHPSDEGRMRLLLLGRRPGRL